MNIDREHKQIRRYAVIDASVRDSQVFDALLDEENGKPPIWGPNRPTAQKHAKSSFEYRADMF